VIEMKKNSSFPILIFIVILGIGAASAYAVHRVSPGFVAFLPLGAAVVLAFIVSSAIQVADQWSKRSSYGLVSFAPSRGLDCF